MLKIIRNHWEGTLFSENYLNTSKVFVLLRNFVKKMQKEICDFDL